MKSRFVSGKNIIAILLLSLTSACAQKEPALEKPVVTPFDPSIPVLWVSMYDSPDIDHTIALSHPYDVEFNVETTSEGQFKLVTSMKLHGGSFYVSPHTGTGFTGKFRVEVAPNDDLSIGTDFIETPRTTTVIDPHRFVHDPVNWVTEDTKYDHPLILNTQEDFMIGGKLIFVIEPKCTLEEIPIIFKYKDGVLTVEKWEC
ncbi:MAG: hypothetical protein JKX84_02560 [Flavobacteriales bacterium]|nr:hypothetical protein [Flavobacteriales bacterium]